LEEKNLAQRRKGENLLNSEVMSIDNAIQNVGEYYAAHYLAERFAKDIADQVKAWKARGSQSVPRRLQALSDLYFRAKSQALEYPDPDVRSRARDTDLRGWHTQLLAALGYVPEPLLLELESEKQVLPAVLRLNRHSRPWLAVLEAAFCLSDGEQAEEPLELTVVPGGAFHHEEHEGHEGKEEKGDDVENDLRALRVLRGSKKSPTPRQRPPKHDKRWTKLGGT
jgi:hypothetical protein